MGIGGAAEAGVALVIQFAVGDSKVAEKLRCGPGGRERISKEDLGTGICGGGNLRPRPRRNATR